MNIKAIIVEDSRLARNELKVLIEKVKEITLIGEAENVDSGYKEIIDKKPDLLFLDINMPGKNGFDLLEMLDDLPIVIFTTAYDEYALKSFDYNTVDYLLKPVSEKRFFQAIEKVKKQLTEEKIKPSSTPELNLQSQLFIREGENCWLIRLEEIQFFEIVGNYTRVFFKGEHPLLYKSLQQIEERLPANVFFRANRQQLVNTHFIKEIQPWFGGKLKLIMQNHSEIEVSRRQSYLFKDQMSF